ncbi:hypothetical protein LTR84_008868 [Exophiala bonariae]|uniref:Glutathione S-transferase n=1 Tax=Exophiala bonariae TaxID=1690606 RepID=A0AAV9MYE8_9EURO|nr:hypothetical protein LTR84_008868 [Exophiala bonariae]
MGQLILHEDPLSANCYKIKLTAALLSIPLERRRYSILAGETKTPEFLQNISAFGRIPVLQIDATTLLPESNAACFYLAENAASLSSSTSTASSPLLNLIPTSALQRADMLRWMFFEQNNHEPTVATLRYWLYVLGEETLAEDRIVQLPGKRVAARQAIDYVEDRLSKSESGWLVGDGITLADICLFAYTHLAHNSGFDLKDWPAVVAWCERIKAVDGFIEYDESN